MADVVSPEKRSEMMAGIRSQNTKPEIIVRKHLHSLGYRYRLGTRIFGLRPDVVLRRHKIAVFVHGCFWHRHPDCKLASNPKSNKERWTKKFEDNVRRDARQMQELDRRGWTGLVIWECQVRDGSYSRNLQNSLRTLDKRGKANGYNTKEKQIITAALARKSPKSM